MDSSVEVVVDDRDLPPDRLWAHAGLYSQVEALGDGQEPTHIRTDGGVNFGQIDVTLLQPSHDARSESHSYRPDRIFVLVRIPFSLDRPQAGRRYARVELAVDMANTDVVARSLWPALVTNDREADRARVFTVNQDLILASATVPSGTTAPITRYLDLHPSIVATGTGMSRFGWTLEPAEGYPLVPSGRVVFVVLSLPNNSSAVIGTLSATVEIGRSTLGPLSRVRASTRHLPFSVSLPPAADETRSTADTPTTGSTIFISYANYSDVHARQVADLAAFLDRQGFTVVFDQWSDGIRRDWPAWMIDQITHADFVIAVASAAYRRVGDGIHPHAANRGVQAETALMRELQYHDREKWTRRLLPVVLPGHNLDELPLFLQPYTASHYIVTEISLNGAAGLLRALAGKSSLSRP